MIDYLRNDYVNPISYKQKTEFFVFCKLSIEIKFLKSLQRVHESFNFTQEFLGNIGDATAINSR